MADPDWMYHKDPWVEKLDNWETKKVEYEQQDNDGVLFVNKKKELDWQADFTGKAMVDGKMYWVNLTDKVSKGGNQYKKLKFKPMEDQYASPPRTPVAATGGGKEDIPW